MRKINNIRKYFISEGNISCIYEHINNDSFRCVLMGDKECNDYFNYSNYPGLVIKHIKFVEYQEVKNKNKKIYKIWEEYFGNLK